MRKSILIALCLLLALPISILAQDPAYPSAPATPLNVIQGEFFVDTDPGFGNGTAITFAAGVDVNNIPVTVPTGILVAGVHRLYLRTLNAEGEWSVTTVRNFIINFDPAYPANPAPQNIVKAEQFVDTDPGFGNAVNIPLTPGVDVANIPATINTGALSLGVHRVYVRTLNEEGEWSISSIRSFVMDQDPAYPVNPSPQNIVKAEYFVNTDPGFGNGTNISLTPGLDLVNQNGPINITGLPQGGHKLYIRSLNAEGEWSVTSVRDFVINEDPLYPSAPVAVGNITRVEYFIDTDPGFGNGTSVTITPAVNIADLTFAANTSLLGGGFHKLYIRSLDDWSITSIREFEVIAPSPKVVLSGALTGDFQTLKAAVDAINAGGGSGAVTVTIVDNTTETATVSFNQTNYTVQVIPSGNRVIEGNLAAPVVLLNGADNVTIDGQSHTGANTLTFRNTNTDQSANTIRIDGPAENNVVRRCIVEGSCNGDLLTSGIIAIAAADNGNSVNNRIDSNLIRPATAAGAKNGIAVSTVLSSSTSRINNAQITNNSIENVFINSTQLNHGIVVSRNANNTLIKGNSVYNTSDFNNTIADAQYITIRIAAIGGSGSGVAIDSNFVGGKAPGAAGSKMLISSSLRCSFYGIVINDNTINTSAITRNTVRNFDLSVTNSTTTTNTAFVGMWVNTGNILDYHHNAVGTETNNSIALQNNVSSTGIINNYFHLIQRPVTNPITDNIAGGVTLTTNAISGSTAVPTLTMFQLSGAVTAVNFKNNKVGSTLAGNISVSSNTSSFTLFGIDELVTGANPVINIDSNLVRNLSVTGPGLIIPIRHATNVVTSPVVSIKGNTVTAVSGSGTNQSIRAIQAQLVVNNTTNTFDISGNTISNLSAPPGAGMNVQGIRMFSNGAGNLIKGRIDNNVITGLTSGSTGSFSSAGIVVTQDVLTGDSLVISGNTINNITCASGVQQSDNFGNSTGILFTGTTPNLGQTVIRDNVISVIASTSTDNASIRTFGISTLDNNVLIERNRVFDLTNAAGSSTAVISALHMESNAGDIATGLVRNNMFAINTTTNAGIKGVDLASSEVKVNVYHNSVLVEGSSTANTHALFFSSTATADIKNNILYNAATGSGTAYAIGAENSIGGYTGNNNYFVSPAAVSLAEQNGSSFDMAGWRTLTSQDANTETGVNGVNTNAANLFLNRPVAELLINTANSTEPIKISNKGLALSAAVPEDFLRALRNTTTPDIGAHEFVFSSPLPLNLLTFSGTKQNSNAELQWRTANEINVSHFELQRSDDGQNFVTIGTVQPGSSIYQYTDLNIFNSKQVVFYRLKSVDIDDKFTYSVIIKLLSKPELLLTVYPNPLKDVLAVSGLQQKGTIRLFNAAGKLLAQQTVNAQTVTLDMSRYAKGMYVLQYQSGNDVVSQKIIKQ